MIVPTHCWLSLRTADDDDDDDEEEERAAFQVLWSLSSPWWSQNVLQKIVPNIWWLHDDHKYISTLPTEVWFCVSGWQVSGWRGGGGEGREETQLEWAILSPSLSFDIIWHSASLSFDIDQHNCKKMIVGFTNLIMIIAKCQMTELGNQNLL